MQLAKISRLSTLGLLSAFILALLACETPDDNTIESLRSCVNSASKTAIANGPAGAAQAQSCDTMASASSINTVEMNEIRFGIILLIEQKLSQVAQMAQSMGQAAGANDGLTAAISIMVFSASGGAGATNSTDVTYATRIQGYGNAVGGDVAALGNFIAFATTLSTLGTQISNPSGALTSLQNCASGSGGCTPQEQQTMANSILSAESAACVSPADQTSTNPSDLCFKLKSAIGNANPNNPQQVLQNVSTYASTPH